MRKKETVLLVHNYYQIPGGEDTVVENERNLLEENGHTVILYTRSNAEIRNFSWLQKLLLPFGSIFSIRTYREAKRLIQDANVDIVHVHNTLSLISPSIYYAAFRCGKPVVQTVHNFRLVCPGAVFYRQGQVCEDCIQRGMLCALKHKCYRNSGLQTFVSIMILMLHRMIGTYQRINYICLTEFNMAKLLENRGRRYFCEKRIYIRPNYTENDMRVIPFRNRKKQFVFVGRPETVKGIRILLKAWEKISEYNLIICGTSEEVQWCQEYIGRHEMKNVYMLGNIPNDSVKRILSESLALILPTQLYEGFPMAIVESFSCGTPVIGSDLGNVGILIEEGKTGFKFRHTSWEDLTLKVYKIYDMTEQCRRIYEQRYSKRANYQSLAEIYGKVKETI